MSLDFSLYDGEEEIYDANITHNLTEMADKAGIYEALWRPDKINAKTGADIIEILQTGLHKIKSDPEYFKQFNSENGWGTYKDFVPFVEKCLKACCDYPNATIKVWR